MDLALKKLMELQAPWESCEGCIANDPSIPHTGRPVLNEEGRVLAHAVDIKNSSNAEFQSCIRAFKQTHLRPVVVARIQNASLARRYAMQYADLVESRGAETALEEQNQFHCTSCRDVDDIYRQGRPPRHNGFVFELLPEAIAAVALQSCSLLVFLSSTGCRRQKHE